MGRETRIGGSDTKFVPNVNFSWSHGSRSETHFININRSSVLVSAEKPTTSVDSTRLKVGNETDIFTQLPDGSLEWDIEFETHPGAYSWNWDVVCSPDIVFHYQPINYSQAEITDNAFRPDDIKGSYAVYSGGRGRLVRNGSTLVDYSTGKLCHIKRPKFIDANGRSTWGVLSIKKTGRGAHTLNVSIAKRWFDNATFPVTLDPNFGTETIGGSSASLNGFLWGDDFTVSEAGNADSITLYSNSTGRNWTLGIYDATPTNLLEETAGENFSFDSGGAWNTFDLKTSPAITSSTSYWLNVSADGAIVMYYDVASGEGGYKSSYSYVSGTMLDPITMTSTSYGRKISIYCTYSTSGAGGAFSPPHPLNRMQIKHMLNR